MLKIAVNKRTRELEADFHRKISSMMKACNIRPHEEIGFFTTDELMEFVENNPSKVVFEEI